MNYIFLDESGDLGFNFSKKKTSRFFVIALLFVKNKKPLEKIIKRTMAHFNKIERKSHHGMIHAYKEHPKTIYKILDSLSSQDISVMSIYLNKRKVYTKLQNEKHILYNYVTNILLDRIFTRKLLPFDHPITLIAAKKETNRFLNDNFCSYIKTKTSTNHKLDLSIEIKPAQQDKCLQLIDCISWSIFKDYEYNDESYINTIRPKIVEERSLF